MLDFLRFGVSNSYVSGLDFFRFGVSNSYILGIVSYVYGLVILMFRG